MPATLTAGGLTTTFAYDAEHARTLQTAPGETTVYLNPRWDVGAHYEKTTKTAGNVTTVEHKHYIYAGGTPVALYTVGGTAPTVRYLHKDHLGSVDTVTSETGQVVERFSYDAFGQRRLPSGLDGAVSVTATHHGYTGHEHLDDLGLIHMNGRVYDPRLGRFTSADPIIQDPTDSQSLNRYSYVSNNPLKYTDPSGYKKFWKQKWFREAVKTVAIAVVAVYTGGAAATAFMSSAIASAGGAMAITGAQFTLASVGAGVIGGATGGFTAGLLTSGGEIKPAVRGGIGGGLTGGVGGYFGDAWSVSRVAANSFAGGVSSELQGGEFRDGFKMNAYLSTAALSFDAMRASTNASSAKSGNTLVDPDSGELFTYGGRPPINVNGSLGADRSLLAGLNMTLEPDGMQNSWWGTKAIRQFFNGVSKVHDWGNSWAYSDNGMWVSHGVVRDTLFNVWSISTMPASAAFAQVAQYPGFWSMYSNIQER